MIKVILGWFLVVFGIVGAIAGVMTWIGGGGNGAWFKMIALGIGLAFVGWSLRTRR